MNFKEMREHELKLLKLNVKCNCGHIVNFNSNKNKIICSWCGNYVYKNKKVEFIEKLKKEMRKINVFGN